MKSGCLPSPVDTCMATMRILVTGASGLLGLNLALEAADAARQSIGPVNDHLLRHRRLHGRAG